MSALVLSFGWALVIWWFGEGFGGLTSNTLPSPLMGAPGAAILYAIIGVLVWPTRREAKRSAGRRRPLRGRRDPLRDQGRPGGAAPPRGEAFGGRRRSLR